MSEKKFKERLLGEGGFSVVYQRVGHIPPAVVKYLKDPKDALIAIYMFQVHHVIHRDIKPDNIFVTQNFMLKIGDFGAVKLSERTAACATSIGTNRYMSPPQIEKGQLSDVKLASHRNDVYSMGLVLWEMIERREVLSECCEWNQFKREIFLFNFVFAKTQHFETPKCQATIQEIFCKSTAFDLSLRPDAQQLLVDLENALEGLMANKKEFREKFKSAPAQIF
ncbi:unnamed protein product, partial [Mesorhabditis belari]|uniref:Protein kinase domain-containing protein n=1 Tax=Mesorhabditis belari TaxID=2138241 RepID=A0AAF3EKQ3_9BILA